jgi:hypothetical protein
MNYSMVSDHDPEADISFEFALRDEQILGLNDREQVPSTSPSQEGFSGLIERVPFHSEETGSAVLRVKVKGHRGDCAPNP